MSYRNWWGCTFLGACYMSIRSVNKGIMRFILSLVSSWGKSGKVLIIKFENYFFQPTWCYSKYIEALEQERILLKIQEEMEKKMFTGNFCLSCTELLCCRLAQTNFRSLHRPLHCLSLSYLCAGKHLSQTSLSFPQVPLCLWRRTCLSSAPVLFLLS